MYAAGYIIALVEDAHMQLKDAYHSDICTAHEIPHMQCTPVTSHVHKLMNGIFYESLISYDA